ncbi:hypothetical protein K458DRAFT_424333 [Lentithecium fluviatile CBS 122367]|uniref:AA1-like domain-containing protein n=1 Tax=Lentithecium fluviatile CBS 122367 TaxID=1168545 RepID=A0A6G1IG06_9PLEO|nr:hypothetical protein K458DRAFT_424333 [Lentithecium fluviatile CBS 122367]
MLTSTLFVCLLSTSTLASPLFPRQTTPYPTLTVTNFTAFEADPYTDGARSNLSFHLSDTRPGHEASVDCVVPNTYFNLHAISALYDICGDRNLDFSYSYGERGLTVRRGWQANSTSYLVGTAMQEWRWKEDGPGANVTKFADGKLYARKEEWLFPVTRVQLGTPCRC